MLTSGVTEVITYITNEHLNLVTSIYVNYIASSNTDAEVSTFLDNEVLLTDESVTLPPHSFLLVMVLLVRLFNNPTLRKRDGNLSWCLFPERLLRQC